MSPQWKKNFDTVKNSNDAFGKASDSFSCSKDGLSVGGGWGAVSGRMGLSSGRISTHGSVDLSAIGLGEVGFHNISGFTKTITGEEVTASISWGTYEGTPITDAKFNFTGNRKKGDIYGEPVDPSEVFGSREDNAEQLKNAARANGYTGAGGTYQNGGEDQKTPKDRFKDALDKLSKKYGFSDDVEQQKEKQDALAPEKTEVEKDKSGGPDCSDADRAAGL